MELGGEDEFIVVAKHEHMYEGNKLYWKINRTVDFRIFLCEEGRAIVVREAVPARLRDVVVAVKRGAIHAVAQHVVELLL